MMPVFLAAAALILLIESGMWYLFRRGAVRICIPSTFLVLRKPRVSMAMLQGAAVVHTVLLLTAVIFSYHFLW